MLKSVMRVVIVDRILSKMGVRIKSEERDISAIKLVAIMSRIFNLMQMSTCWFSFDL